MEIKIRDGSINDCTQFCELFKFVEKLHRNELPNIYQEPSDEYIEAHFKSILDDISSKLLIAEKNSQCVGYIYFNIKITPSNPILKPTKFLLIEQLAVHPKFRRLKIGQQLMKSVEQFAVNNNIHDIKLNVWSFNQDAILFYNKLGYINDRILFSKKI